MAPKVHGAWNLHQATLTEPLDLFVMFSSAAAILGAHGQGNYAAANAFMDGLARHRRQQGLPALSINWGPWQVSGMAAESHRQEGIQRRGVWPMAPEQAFRVLESLIATKLAEMVVMDIDWKQALRLYTDGPPPVASDLARDEGIEQQAARSKDHALVESLESAAPAERRALLIKHFVETLAKVISQDPSRIDPAEPLKNLGLDSLMAIELKNAIESSLGVSVSIAVLVQDPSLEQLADHVLELWSARNDGPVAAPNRPSSLEKPTAGLAAEPALSRGA
jgi:acyl carrier protein